MKRFLTVALAAALGLATAGVASAVDSYEAGNVAGGILSSRHNLGAFSMHISTTSTTEICIFCHTPHHTNKGGEVQAPLWNRGNAVASSSFTAYGETAANTQISGPGSASLACLSCHDGTTTFDNIVNAPGKDQIVASGSSRGWAFSDFGDIVSGYMTSARLNIGTDLSNDHPMSVVYNGGLAASLRATTQQISTIDLTSDLASSVTTYDGGNLTKNLWAVGGFISQDAKISDLLRSTTNGLGDRVECSSCHDPHFNNKSWNEVDGTYTTDVGEQEFESNGLFLRRVGGNTGSGVCRTCHNK